MLETKKTRFNSLHLSAIFFLALVVTAAVYLTGDENKVIIRKQGTRIDEHNTTKKQQTTSSSDSASDCNLFSGRWIFDNASSPLYREEQCSFMDNEYACQKYGRRDAKYQLWRWRPHECDLPRFNGTAMLEKIREKRLVFVGDSLNRNQWTSMLCLVEPFLDRSQNKSFICEGNSYIFRVEEYNATIEFYWSPLLVESNCDNPHDHSVKDRIIRITSIEKHARHWTDADILVFDSFMWWLDPTMTILWGSFGSPEAIYKRVEMRLRRYEMAISTWSDWLEININRTKTKLFFMSLSPSHSVGENWGDGQNCYKETEPVVKDGYWGIATDREMMRAVESAIEKLDERGLKVEYLNITNLSDYRKDGHPSIYRKFRHQPSAEQLADPRSYADCVHWCLPGVPDVWNQIFFSYIMKLVP